jgi:hypothetical protein
MGRAVLLFFTFLLFHHQSNQVHQLTNSLIEFLIPTYNQPTYSLKHQQSTTKMTSDRVLSSLTKQKLEQQIKRLKDNNTFLRKRLEEEYSNSHNLAAQVQNLQVDFDRAKVREAKVLKQLQSAQIHEAHVEEAMDRVEAMRQGIIGFCKSMDVFERTFWGVEVTARVKKLEACLRDQDEEGGGTDDQGEEVNDDSSDYTFSLSSSSASCSSSSFSSFSQEQPEDEKEKEYEVDDEEEYAEARGPPTHRRHSIKTILKLPRKPTITASLVIGTLCLLSLPLGFLSKRHHVHFDYLAKDDGGSSAATRSFLTQVNGYRVQKQGLFARFWWEKKVLFW